MGADFSSLVALGWEAPAAADDGVRYCSEEDGAGLSYPAEGLEVLGLEGGSGFWFEHRSASVARILERFGVDTMWEVGSGTGSMASRLCPPLHEVITVEPLAEGARAAANLGLEALCGTLEEIALPSGSIECVGAFDVIEHIDAAPAFLHEVRRVLQPGGLAVVSVPAFSALWGEEDDIAGHFRRYTRRRLNQEFSAAGFIHVHSEYLFAGLVPIAALTRGLPYRVGVRRGKERVLASMRAQLDLPPWIERMARVELRMEHLLSRVLPLPFGLSIIAAFRKPEA